MQKRLLFLLPLAVFLVIAFYFARGLQLDPRKLPNMLDGKQVPAFTLPPILDRDDHGFASTDLPGGVSLVNIWGSWCVACRVEHPFLMRLKERNKVPIHGIDWREKTPEEGPAWLEKFGDPYALVGDDPVSKAAIAFGVTGAPETFLVDQNGVVRYKQVGPIDAKIWDEVLWPLIETLRRDGSAG